MIADPSAADRTLPPDPTDQTPSARLTRMVNKAIATDIPASIGLGVHAAPSGDSVTLDCATGARLSEAADQAACAATLLQLCAGLDDADLRIGLIGEYDEVHLYKMMPAADLDASDLIDAALSLVPRAEGLRTLVAAAPRLRTEDGVA